MIDVPRYGLLAEFATVDELVAAVERTRDILPRCVIEAYSPFPIEGLDEAIGQRSDRVPLFMLLGAVLAGASTFAIECYSAVFDYPINVGGRPTGSWPAFLPPAIEMTVLGAVLFGVLAMLIGNALPRLHHPLFGIASFQRASTDRFFLLLRADNPDFDFMAAHALLRDLAPLTITEVPA